jgi:hypothetical protein
LLWGHAIGRKPIFNCFSAICGGLLAAALVQKCALKTNQSEKERKSRATRNTEAMTRFIDISKCDLIQVFAAYVCDVIARRCVIARIDPCDIDCAYRII